MLSFEIVYLGSVILMTVNPCNSDSRVNHPLFNLLLLSIFIPIAGIKIWFFLRRLINLSTTPNPLSIPVFRENLERVWRI